jgi:hypothetical protein
MSSTNLHQSGELPYRREMTAEEQAEFLALYKSQFDPVEAEREYGEMLEKGGVPWEQLLQELDEIDHQGGTAQPRSV